jgi:VWFA-related protein
MRYAAAYGRFAAIIALLISLTGQCSGQSPQSVNNSDVTIQLNVNLIQIDVTVLDKNRKPAVGLTAEDFEVSRDGKKQKIQKVLFVGATQRGQVTTTTAAAPVIATAATIPGRQLQAKDVRRTIAIFIDDLSVGFGSLIPMRSALRKFVEEEIVAGDLVAIYRSSSGLGLFQQFTTDKRAILAGIDTLRFRNINGVDSLAPIDTNPLENSTDPTIAQMAVEQRQREDINNHLRQDMLTSGMLSNVSFIVRGLREMPGRKSMVIFSESVQLFDIPQTFNNPTANPLIPGAQGGTRERTMQSMRSLIDTANRSGVTFYTIDPRGLQVLGPTAADNLSTNPIAVRGMLQQREMDFRASQGGMAMLAEETGGIFFKDTNDLSRALSEAAADQDGYYLIAFQPDDETFEKTKAGQAKMHKLAIKVRQPGLKVRYRKSFAGVPDAEIKAVHPLVTAMTSPFRSFELPMKMTPLYAESAQDGPFIRTLIFLDPRALQFTEFPAGTEGMDPKVGPWLKATVHEMVMLYDQSGKAVDQIANTHTIRIRKAAFERAARNGIAQTLDLPIKTPGLFQVRAAILDEATKKTGSAAQFVFVPDLKNNQLAMSDISLASESFMRAESSDGAPATRVLRPGEKFNYGAYIYNAKTSRELGKPNLETQIILYQEGKAIFTGKKTAFRPDRNQEAEPLMLTGNLTLGAKIAPGQYVLQVAIRDLEAPKKHQYTLRSADFEVKLLDDTEKRAPF